MTTDDTLQRMPPDAFQRLAIDAFHAHLVSRHPDLHLRVRRFDLLFGVNDGGFDGELIGEYRGLAPPIAIEVKRVRRPAALLGLMKEYWTRPGRQDRSLVLLTSASLTRDQIEGLEQDGRVVVFAGGDIAAWVREHAWIARAYQLDRQPAHLRPPSELWHRVRTVAVPVDGSQPSARQVDPSPAGGWLPTEARATEDILRKAQGEGSVVLVEADRGALPDRVLADVSWKLQSRGGSLPVWWVPQPARLAEDPTALSELSALRAQLIVQPQTPTDVERLLSAFRDPRRLGWIVLAPERARGIEAAFVTRGLRPITVRLARPDRRELVTWASNIPADRPDRGPSASEVVEALGRADLVAVWKQSPAYLPLYLASTSEPQAVVALAWLGLFEVLRPDDIERLAAQSGGLDLRDGLRQARQRGLADDQGGVWRATAPSLGSLGLLAALAAGRLNGDLLTQALGQVDELVQEQAVARLAVLPSWANTYPAISAALDRIRGAWGSERQVRTLARTPAAFLGELREVRTAIAQLRNVPDRTAAFLAAEVLFRHVPAFPDLAQDAAEALRFLTGARPHDRTLVQAIVDPSRVPGWAARRALETLRRWARDPDAASGALWMATAAKLWLANDVSVSRTTSRGTTVRAAPWDTSKDDVRAAFSAAGDLVGTMLTAPSPQVRDSGWAILAALGQDSSGLSIADRPPELQAALEGVLDRAITTAHALDDLVDRAMAEVALLRVVRLDWAEARAVEIVESLRDDPLYVAFRYFAFADRRVADPKAYAEALRSGAAVDWTRFQGVTALDDPHAAEVGRRLAQSGAGQPELDAVLRAAGEVLDRAARVRDLGVRAGGFNSVLTAWAQADPGLFERLLTTRRWAQLHPEVRWWVVGATLPIFGDRWAAIVDGEDAPALGVGAALTRLLHRPEQVAEAEALRLIPVAWASARPGSRMALLYRLASHPSGPVREMVCRRLQDVAENARDLDARDAHAVLTRLLEPPDIAGVLELMGWLRDDHPLRTMSGFDLDSSLFDALERLLVGALESRERVSARNLDELLRRFVRARPEAAWRIAPFVADLPAFYEQDLQMRGGIDDATLRALLGAAPSDVRQMPGGSRLHDGIARSLSEQAFTEVFHETLERDPRRAAGLLQARGLRPETIERSPDDGDTDAFEGIRRRCLPDTLRRALVDRAARESGSVRRDLEQLIASAWPDPSSAPPDASE